MEEVVDRERPGNIVLRPWIKLYLKLALLLHELINSVVVTKWVGFLLLAIGRSVSKTSINLGKADCNDWDTKYKLPKDLSPAKALSVQAEQLQNQKLGPRVGMTWTCCYSLNIYAFKAGLNGQNWGAITIVPSHKAYLCLNVRDVKPWPDEECSFSFFMINSLCGHLWVSLSCGNI